MNPVEACLRLGIALCIAYIAKLVLELAMSGADSLIVGVVIGFFIGSLDKIISLASSGKNNKE